jgi:hypothetical protein
MSAAIKIYNLEAGSPAPDLGKRGHHVIYRMQETNRCPGCGRAQWHVGRLTAECAFCSTAIVLAEAHWGDRSGTPAAPARSNGAKPAPAARGAEKRRHERMPVTDRSLELLIGGTPHSMAIHNLSAGGLMGDAPTPLEAGATVHVRFEGGIIVPATVKWSADDRIGLAFDSPVIFDASDF